MKIDYSFSSGPKYQVYRRLEPVSENSAFFRLAFNARKMVARGELGKVALDKFAFVLGDKKKNRGPRKVRPAPDWTVPIMKELARDPRNILVIKNELTPEVADLVDEAGIPALDLSETLTDLEAEGVDPFYWPVSGKRGHWNQYAHAAIGHYLAREISGRLDGDTRVGTLDGEADDR